jgi:uncharacterized protein
VTSTAAEIPSLLDALVARGWAVPGRIAIAGVSLGGFVAYGAATIDPRIAAAVCITASPQWGDDGRSPHLRLDRFFPVALLSIVAGADPVVPPEHAAALHAALAPRYAAAPERLRLVELPGAVHRLAEADRALARREAEAWIARYLAPGSARAR